MIACVVVVLVVMALGFTVLKVVDRIHQWLICAFLSFAVVGAAAPISQVLDFSAFHQNDLWFTLLCVGVSFATLHGYVCRGWVCKVLKVLNTGTEGTDKKVLIDDRRQPAKSRKTVELDTEGASTVWEM